MKWIYAIVFILAALVGILVITIGMVGNVFCIFCEWVAANSNIILLVELIVSVIISIVNFRMYIKENAECKSLFKISSGIVSSLAVFFYIQLFLAILFYLILPSIYNLNDTNYFSLGLNFVGVLIVAFILFFIYLMILIFATDIIEKYDNKLYYILATILMCVLTFIVWAVIFKLWSDNLADATLLKDCVKMYGSDKVLYNILEKIYTPVEKLWPFK